MRSNSGAEPARFRTAHIVLPFCALVMLLSPTACAGSPVPGAPTQGATDPPATIGDYPAEASFDLHEADQLHTSVREGSPCLLPITVGSVSTSAVRAIADGPDHLVSLSLWKSRSGPPEYPGLLENLDDPSAITYAHSEHYLGATEEWLFVPEIAPGRYWRHSVERSTACRRHR